MSIGYFTQKMETVYGADETKGKMADQDGVGPVRTIIIIEFFLRK